MIHNQLISRGRTVVDGVDLVALRGVQIPWRPKAVDESIPKEARTRLAAFYDQHGVKVVTDPSIASEDLFNLTALHERIGGSHLPAQTP